MIDLDPKTNPTSYRFGDENTTLKETAESVSQAYNKPIDALNALLDLSIEIRTNGTYHTPHSHALMEQHIERIKSILESENLRFYYMTKAIRSADKVDKIRAWKAMNQQDVELALLKEGEERGGGEARRKNVELVKWAVREYGLADLWVQAEQRDNSEGRTW